MSIHLMNVQQTNAWAAAVEAVEEVASNTDSNSTSKPFIDTLARFVRDEPEVVSHVLTLV